MIFRLLSFIALVAVPVASQCTLCADGRDPVLPSDPTQASICEQVIALLPGLNPGACTGFQEGEYPLLCGCDASFNYTCDVCPNGGTPNPFGDVNVELCNRIKFSASAATNADQCVANLQTYWDNVNVTVACGCPGVPTPCSICGDGSAVGNPDQAIGQLNTCQGYDTFLSTFSADSAECVGKSESGLPIVCGCPNAGTGSACSICDGGAQRGEPRISDFADFCTNADNKALFVPLDSCEGNTDMYDQWACGCPDAVPPCTLCEDGSDFVSDRPSDFSKQGQTCAYDQFALKYIVNLDCAGAQATVGETCGCSNPKADLTACRICGTGLSLPDPNIFVQSFLHTCGFIEYFASAEVAAQTKTCTFYRGEYVNVCCEDGPDPYPGRTETPVTPPPFGNNPFFQPIGAPILEPAAPSVVPAPVLAPADAPIVPLTAAPVVPMTSAPVSPVTTAPVPVVTAAPVASGTSAPVLVSPTVTATPVASGTAAPLASGTAAPAASGTAAPAASGTAAPAASETAAPAASETAAPAASETVAPAASETVAPAASETVAPAVVAPTSTTAPVVSGTAAPAAVEPTSTSAPIASETSAPAEGMTTAAPITSAPAGATTVAPVIGNETSPSAIPVVPTVAPITRAPITSGAMRINIIVASSVAISALALLL